MITTTTAQDARTNRRQLPALVCQPRAVPQQREQRDQRDRERKQRLETYGKADRRAGSM